MPGSRGTSRSTIRHAPEVALTNDDEAARTFVFGFLVPWDGLWGAHWSSDASLLMAPSDSVVPDGPTDDCWPATSGAALPAVMRGETVDHGETVTGELAGLAAHDTDHCHPHGTYRFGDTSYLENDWWFDVDVVPVTGE